MTLADKLSKLRQPTHTRQLPPQNEIRFLGRTKTTISVVAMAAVAAVVAVGAVAVVPVHISITVRVIRHTTVF